MKKRLMSSLLVFVVLFSQSLAVSGFAEEGEASFEPLSPEAQTQIQEEIMLAQASRNTKSDRFIVKYKSESARQGAQAAADAAFVVGKSKNLAEKNLLESKIAALGGDAREDMRSLVPRQSGAEPRSAGIFGGGLTPLEITSDAGLTEVIRLDEAVDSADFIGAFRAEVGGENLEYIQEDVKMGLSAGLSGIGGGFAPDPSVLPQPGVSANTGKIVAVIDTGIDVNHPDLLGRTTDGWDFVNDLPDVYSYNLGEEQDHGTHVAGIIAQAAPDAGLMPLKVFESGAAYTSDIIAAIEFAEANGASVVNCSWGAASDNPALREAMENSGMLFVCAAGNNRANLGDAPIYPASFGLENTISVASVNQDLGMSYFSNYGNSVDVAAIGRDVVSGVAGGESRAMSGTSMSAAFVSAAAAMVESGDAAAVKTALKSGADKLSCLLGRVDSGNYLNMENAVSGLAGSAIAVNPADDFDVWFEKTPSETWELFNASPTVQVAAGWEFTMALKANGTVWAWGSNANGQLGNGTYSNKYIPTKVAGLTNVKAIAAGNMHAIALTNAGDVYTWGDDIYYQAGNNGTRNVPSINPITGGVKSISAGNRHTAIAKENGDVYAWGWNEYGQLGNGAGYAEKNRPAKVPGVSGVKAVAAGIYYSVALKENGEVHAWGYGGAGHLGNMTGNSINTANVLTTGAKAIAGAYLNSIVIKENGDVYVWGTNENGLLGDGSSVASRSAPSVVPVLQGARSATASHSHIAVLTQDGKVYAWGLNAYGRLGLGSAAGSFGTPQQVTDFSVYEDDDVESEIRFKLNGVATDFLYAGGTVAVQLSAGSAIPSGATVILTVHKIAGDTVKAAAHGGLGANVSVAVPADYQNYYVRAMVWNSLTGMVQIMPSVKLYSDGIR